jgi:hypothetical protein
MEIALMNYFNVRLNLVVPNVFWGMFTYEMDLLVVTKSGYAYEVEIKTSKADLIKDKGKPHHHDCSKISRLYFAIPESLVPHIEHIPEHAGILVVKNVEYGPSGYYQSVDELRGPKSKYSYQFTAEEKYKIARLGTMRILGLKECVRSRVKDYNALRILYDKSLLKD